MALGCSRQCRAALVPLITIANEAHKGQTKAQPFASNGTSAAFNFRAFSEIHSR
jgi:hypothetical protein